MLTVTAKLDRNKIDFNRDYEGHLMVGLAAPEDKDTQRTPICAVLVLDVSGSMSGPTDSGRAKIEVVKDVAAKAIGFLTRKDELAIVTYSSVVEVLLPRMNAGNKEPARRAIEHLQPTSCTNMSGGLLEGLKQINAQFKGVQRVMLLTDGLANEGVSDRDGLLKLVRERNSQATISTFGFGLDADQELLADMAKAGGGNYYYIKGSDIGGIFAREFGGIASCVAQGLEIRVAPSRGNQVVEVLNDYTVSDDKGTAVIRAEDIYAGETKHILVKMKLAKLGRKPKDRQQPVASVDVQYANVRASDNHHESHKVMVEYVPAGKEDPDILPEIAEQLALLNAAKAQDKAVDLANAGDFTGAQAVLKIAVEACIRLKTPRGDNARERLEASMKRFSRQNYDQHYGNSLKYLAKAAMRQRAAGGQACGALNDMYMNKGVAEAMPAFHVDPQPGLRKSRGNSGPSVPADSTFAKKRVRRR